MSLLFEDLFNRACPATSTHTLPMLCVSIVICVVIGRKYNKPGGLMSLLFEDLFKRLNSELTHA
jgi:hypothetical protein